MPTLVLRQIDPDLWRKVQDRAKAEQQPMRRLTLRLFELYAAYGLTALERAGEQQQEK
jgi:hypothetical protein